MKTQAYGRRRYSLFDIIVYMVLLVLALFIIYPFYNCLLVSLVTSKEYVNTPFMLIPRQPTLNSYLYVFSNKAILNGFFVTFIVVTVGVVYNMILSLATAYALSRKGYPGHGIIINLIIFTMYFSGGLVPYYLLMRDLHLINNVFSMVFPVGINTFYMIVMMNYFRTLPKELEESAKADGANDITVLLKIMLPISLPIIATFVLFYSVDRWNEWWNGMLFIKTDNKRPLQLVLRSIINVSADATLSEAASSYFMRDMFADGIKMASVIVTMMPIMCVYPFLQKYFMKGLLIGAIKS